MAIVGPNIATRSEARGILYYVYTTGAMNAEKNGQAFNDINNVERRKDARGVGYKYVNFEFNVLGTIADFNIEAYDNLSSTATPSLTTIETSANNKIMFPMNFAANVGAISFKNTSTSTLGGNVSASIDFMKDSDVALSSVVKIVNLLDVQDPTSTKFKQVTVQNRDEYIEEFFSDLNELLSSMAPVVLDSAIDVYLAPSSKANPRVSTIDGMDIDRPDANLSDDLATVDLVLKTKPSTASDYKDWTVLKSALLERKDILESLSRNLKKDISKVWVTGGVDANVSAGTNFGIFVQNWRSIFDALAEHWVLDAVKKKQDDKIKKSSTADKNKGKASSTVVNADSAQLQAESDAIVAGNQIIRVPFKNTNTFPGENKDYDKALSMLDILRDELVQIKVDEKINVRESDKSGEFTALSCEEALKKLDPRQLKELANNLKNRAVEAKNKLVKLYQQLKKVESSKNFKLSADLTGLKKLWPPNFDGIDLPIIDVAEQLKNSAAGIAAAAKFTGKQVANGFKNLRAFVKKPSIGDITIPTSNMKFGDIFKNVYGDSNMGSNRTFCQSLNDMKKVIDRANEVKESVEKVKASVTSTLNQYQDKLEEIKTQIDELKNIERLSSQVTTALAASASNIAAKAQSATTAQVQAVVDTAKQKVNGVVKTSSDAQRVIDASSNSVGKVTV
jgi:hypothetical protein